MDETQSPEQENQDSDLANTSKTNNYEPQPPTPEQPKPVKSRKKTFILLLVILLLLGAVGAAAYFMTQDDEPAPVETTQTIQESEEPAEEVKTDVTYKSKLYPDLSFTVPEGWEVTEPKIYDESVNGEGSADSTITISNGEVILKLEIATVFPTGFEGYSCYNYEGLNAAGNAYRFVDKKGAIVYKAGTSESDDEWAEIIADEGNFTYFEDPDPNFCVQFPFIGTYSSTLNQSDYPSVYYGYTENEKVTVWMSASIDGAPTEAQLADTDAIIKSLSQPDLGV